MGDPFIHQGFLPAEEGITFKFAFDTYLPDIRQDIWHVSLAYIPAAGYMDIPRGYDKRMDDAAYIGLSRDPG